LNEEMKKQVRKIYVRDSSLMIHFSIRRGKQHRLTNKVTAANKSSPT